MADVFISYAKAQRALTESLAKDLEAAGLSTWWDTGLRPGENFRNKIDDQLNACKAAVIIWTPEAVKSDWVISEADHAWQQKKLVNTHVPEIKPYQIPKPFNQSHSAEVANRAVIIDAIRARIAQHTLVGEPGLDASASDSHRTREEPTADGRGRGGFLRWSYGLVGALAAAVLATLVGLFFLDIVPRPTRPTAPIPKWDLSGGDTFIGEPIPLAWKFDRSALVNVDGSKSESSILFELSSSNDDRFGADTRMETYADGDRKFVWHINATRFWRVRAVESRTKKPLSDDWSLAIRITQYDSAYDRIKATGKVLIYVSNAEIQGTFKWVDAKGLRGFDIELSKLIVDELSGLIGHPLEVQRLSVPWTQLLETPRKEKADFIISSITKLETRKREFGIEFSEPYYCTTHTLIYRAGAPDRTIREMITGKTVGVQDKTTNARLAEELAKESSFHLKTFDTTETLINALMRSEIDYGIADIPFAVSAQIATRSGGQDRLGFKTFRDEDFPASVPEAERVEEYAIAVRGGEHQLLSVIDGVIGKAKQDGTLARLFRQATQEFENAPSVTGGSRAGDTAQERPWLCLR
jgi:polar amino acid transport system substrate-binding protein